MRKAVEKMKIEAEMFGKMKLKWSEMCENWSQNESKLPLGVLLGPSGRPLGALWVSRGVPRLKTQLKNRTF